MGSTGNLATAWIAARAGALAATTLALLSPAQAADRSATDAWPVAVEAHYRLRYNGLDVGHLEVRSTTSERSYALSGTGKVSVLFGAITWAGNSTVQGAISGGRPAPQSYSFEWRNNRKGGAIRMSYKDRAAADVNVVPPVEWHKDQVPLATAHKTGALDPVSAIMMLTRADGGPVCDRRAQIFDGKQRYDIVMTFKRHIRLPGKRGGEGEIAEVCRATYEPVAGHRANEATRTYAANRDVEVVMRRVPGTDMVIPYSVTVPTFWGTGSMTTDRIEVTTAKGGKVAIRD